MPKISKKNLKKSAKNTRSRGKRAKTNKNKISKKCFKIYNPYHEALVYQYLGKNRKNAMKNLDKKWDEFTKKVSKNHTCIKFSEYLLKDGGKKMIEYKI